MNGPSRSNLIANVVIDMKETNMKDPNSKLPKSCFRKPMGLDFIVILHKINEDHSG